MAVAPSRSAASVRELRACSLARQTDAAWQDTALSVSGGRTGADEESGAPAKRRKERTTGHRAVSVCKALSGAARGRRAEDAAAAAAPPAGMRSGRACLCGDYSV
ncbi:hypothetical protein [Sporomusa aerivorans]|uniref:hypothetical protein n=1 Tax=Sporomusa aerivorans TaxID=204936 RepID=UPI00352B7F0E